MSQRTHSPVRVNVLLLCLIGLSGPLLHAQSSSQENTTTTLSEGTLRKAAVKSTAPAYPKKSIQHGDFGVAVAEIEINQQGDVTNVDVLEAPSQDIAAAVHDALRQWKFPVAYRDGQAISVRGKLTYYFTLSGSTPTVVDPSQIGYLGKQTRRNGAKP